MIDVKYSALKSYVAPVIGLEEYASDIPKVNGEIYLLYM